MNNRFKKWFIRSFLFLAFCLLIFVSPYCSDIALSDKIQISFGGALLCFLSPVVGRYIAVNVFHCREWDKEVD